MRRNDWLNKEHCSKPSYPKDGIAFFNKIEMIPLSHLLSLNQIFLNVFGE